MSANIYIHYHLYDQQPDSSLLQRAAELLDEKECLRLEKFKVNKAAHQFLLGRYLAKTAIAKKLGMQAEECRFHLSDNGKPSLSNSEEIAFSIAHCDGAVFVALAQQNVGIDIEKNIRFDASISQKFFTPKLSDNISEMANGKAETSELSAVYWTAIEAIVKLEDSSIFSERSRFDFFMDESANYPAKRNVNLVNCLVNKELTLGVATNANISNSIQLEFFCYGQDPADIRQCAQTRELSIGIKHRSVSVC